jgi:hypothetical protein
LQAIESPLIAGAAAIKIAIVLFVSSAFWISRSNKVTEKNPGSLLSKNACLLLTILGLLQWNNAAISASDFELATPPATAKSFHSALGDTLSTPWPTMRECPVVVNTRRMRNQHKICLPLGTRTDLASSNPSGQPGGLTLLACDIDEDSLQDIIVANPAATHSIMIWPSNGEGGFISGKNNIPLLRNNHSSPMLRSPPVAMPHRVDSGIEASPIINSAEPK